MDPPPQTTHITEKRAQIKVPSASHPPQHTATTIQRQKHPAMEHLTPEEQKRWRANPLIEFLIQSFINDVRCKAAAPTAPPVPEPIPNWRPDQDDDETNQIEPIWDLFHESDSDA